MDWYLNKSHTDPAYHCGRLFAVLGFAQEKAMGAVNGSVTRRFFGSVMASPGTHAGRLISLCEKAHLPALPRRRAKMLRAELQMIHRGVGNDYPKRLTLAGQSTFTLGYYHELAFLDHHPPARYWRVTKGGDLVQSLGERVVANHLFDLKLDYSYETMLALPSGLRWQHRYPDFLVHNASESGQIIVEYLGMMDHPDYAAEWEAKKADYRLLGIHPINEQPGPRGRWMSIEPGENGPDGITILRQLRAVFRPFDQG